MKKAVKIFLLFCALNMHDSKTKGIFDSIKTYALKNKKKILAGATIAGVGGYTFISTKLKERSVDKKLEEQDKKAL